jgi:hypothetical protein
LTYPDHPVGTHLTMKQLESQPPTDDPEVLKSIAASVDAILQSQLDAPKLPEHLSPTQKSAVVDLILDLFAELPGALKPSTVAPSATQKKKQP